MICRSTMVIATGNPSGSIEAIWLMATMRISVKGSPATSQTRRVLR